MYISLSEQKARRLLRVVAYGFGAGVYFANTIICYGVSYNIIWDEMSNMRSTRAKKESETRGAAVRSLCSNC